MLLPKDFQYQYAVRNYRVVDGDTIWLDLIVGFDVYLEQACRLVGIDTPEKSTIAGKLVKQVSEKWCSTYAPLYIVSVNRDKYAGRFDGLVWDSTHSHTLNEFMLQEGLARPYAGGKKPRWYKKDLLVIEKKAKLILQLHEEYNDKA
jgi:endonuclease YncB( thermonuclease family)